MIDWITVVVPYVHNEPIYGGFSQRFDADGVFKSQREEFRQLEGSWESSVVIKSHFRGGDSVFGSDRACSEVWVSGNPAKFLQGHNCWGTDNLPALVPHWLVQVFAAAALSVDRFTLKRWIDGDYQLDRVDVTQMVAVEPEASIPDVLGTLVNSASLVHRGRGNVTHGTVTFGKKSGRHTVAKFYDKSAELRTKRGKPDAFLPRRWEVIEWARGKLRAEWEVHSRELEKRGLRNGSAWHADTAELLWSDLMEKLSVSSQAVLMPDVFRSLSNTLRRTYSAWESGRDLRTSMSRAQWYRHRKQLLAVGIDIAAPRTDARPVVVHLPQFIRSRVAHAPDWAERLYLGRAA